MYVNASPEELVRQSVLRSMEALGYPKSLVVVERQLRDVVASSAEVSLVPDRRVDIVCFSPNTLKPLLLIECKALRFDADVLSQVVGYNAFLNASFIAIANPHEILTGWYDAGSSQYRFIKTLPPYMTLLEASYGSDLSTQS